MSKSTGYIFFFFDKTKLSCADQWGGGINCTPLQLMPKDSKENNPSARESPGDSWPVIHVLGWGAVHTTHFPSQQPLEPLDGSGRGKCSRSLSQGTSVLQADRLVFRVWPCKYTTEQVSGSEDRSRGGEKEERRFPQGQRHPCDFSSSLG